MRLGLSLQQAATKTGIDFRQLQQLETGRANPTMRTLQRVTTGYSMSIGSLIVAAESALVAPRTQPVRSPGVLRVAEPIAAEKSSPEKPTDIASRFAANVATAREQLQLTVRALAERAGISVWYVRRIESAAQVPTLRVAEQVAVALDMPLASLISGAPARSYAAR